jgi:hypothetical protein
MMLAMVAFVLAAVAAWLLPEFRSGSAPQRSTAGAGASTA